LRFVDFDGWQFGLLFFCLIVNNFIFILLAALPEGETFDEGVLIGE
jgi:hypothetical protein